MTIRMRPIGLAMIAVCVVASTLASAQPAKVSFAGRFTDETRTRRFELPVPPDAKSATVRLEATVQKGDAAWRLSDPSGKRRWSGEAGRGSDVELSETLADVPGGTWTLELDLRGATGTFDLTWSSR